MGKEKEVGNGKVKMVKSSKVSTTKINVMDMGSITGPTAMSMKDSSKGITVMELAK